MVAQPSQTKKQDALFSSIIPMGVLNVVASIVSPILFLMAGNGRINMGTGLVWLAAIWAGGLIQSLVLIFHQKWRDTAPQSWAVGYSVLQALIGVSWASAILITPKPGEEFAMNALLLAFLVGATGAVVVAFAGSRMIGRSFLWAQWATYILLSIMLGKDLNLTLTGLMVCAVASMYLEVTHRTLAEAVEGRLRSAEEADELSHLATTDSLTGLKNRPAVLDALQQMLRTSNPTVLFIDLDGFKAINDTYGHARGDQVLREVSRRLSAGVRSTDIVGRLGGDEFVIVIPSQLEEKVGGRLAKELTESIAEPFLGDPDVSVTASVGIAEAQPSMDAESLLERADMAMYYVKGSGGGTHQTYQEIKQQAWPVEQPV